MRGDKNVRSKTESKTQLHFLSLEDLVPEDHLIGKTEKAISLDFIYDEVKELYSDKGRVSINPVVLIKLNIIQYTFEIRSMRQTIKDTIDYSIFVLCKGLLYNNLKKHIYF